MRWHRRFGAALRASFHPEGSYCIKLLFRLHVHQSAPWRMSDGARSCGPWAVYRCSPFAKFFRSGFRFVCFLRSSRTLAHRTICMSKPHHKEFALADPRAGGDKYPPRRGSRGGGCEARVAQQSPRCMPTSPHDNQPCRLPRTDIIACHVSLCAYILIAGGLPTIDSRQ
jgi:hypothetical protein